MDDYKRVSECIIMFGKARSFDNLLVFQKRMEEQKATLKCDNDEKETATSALSLDYNFDIIERSLVKIRSLASKMGNETSTPSSTNKLLQSVYSSLCSKASEEVIAWTSKTRNVFDEFCKETFSSTAAVEVKIKETKNKKDEQKLKESETPDASLVNALFSRLDALQPVLLLVDPIQQSAIVKLMANVATRLQKIVITAQMGEKEKHKGTLLLSLSFGLSRKLASLRD
eukprot:CAMPEP_0184486592 /NCGR_PEP_ID=MMETSP0113_2-20130426/8075_1 /TAXON_ID=91329 /ORGANISM="Norrisiella sphaerica, Strain BC52" /LENGTH=227 /DNA_ID=CAMNT_0026868545 /DNA_START=32 /DNA_END=712 /DNA_ORIENTATION=-